jgi:heme/copper-type cytochrome/quinol oxidase subunit 3
MSVEAVELPEVAAHTEAHHHTSLGLSNTKLAMWLFLGSECLLFGALISSYLVSLARFQAEVEAGNPNVVPVGTQLFDTPFTAASSFILLMSSLTVVLALNAVKRGNYRGSRVWLAATIFLGATFIAGQTYEFTAFYNEGLGFTTNLFGSAFYTLTGFHGVHVTGGLLMLSSLLLMSFRGKLKRDRAETVEVVALYWHFVDIVWILIFTIVYLLAPQT